MSTLKGIFSSPKPIRRNFIQENVRQLRDVQRCRQSQTENESVQRSVGKLSVLRTHLNVPSHHVNSAKMTSKSRPDPQDMKSRIIKSDQLGPVHNGVAANKASFGKQIATNELKVKQPRKVKAAARAKQEVDAEQMKEKDVEKYVRQQRASILNKQNVVNSQQLSDTDLSLELSGDSVEVPDLMTPLALTHRTTGSQTIDPKNLDNLYTEGFIRYPSTHKNTVPTSITKPKLVGNSVQPTAQKENRPTDFVQSNVATVASLPNRFSVPNADPTKAPPTYQKGVVPKYLQKRQVEWQKESEEVQKNIPDPACPPGHVALPESERRETLKMIRKSHADYVHELNMMPVRTDTLRMRQRKMELEKQLNKLEEGIKVFSRPKVFVKIGE